ncbi:MAG: hypothetical protein AAF184_15855 [Pseudomonadota bacterium]
MSESKIRAETLPNAVRLSLMGLALFALLGAGAVVLAQGGEDEPAAEEEDFGAGDFSAPTAQGEEEAPQRIDLGNSGGGGAITAEEAAEAASPRTDGGDASDEDGAGVDDTIFVPTEEIRVDTDIAFPVDI